MVSIVQKNGVGIQILSLFILFGFPISITAGTLARGAKFDWLAHARPLLLWVALFAWLYFASTVMSCLFPHFHQTWKIFRHIYIGYFFGWLPCYMPHRPVFWDLRPMHVAVAEDGVKFAKEQPSTQCGWWHTRSYAAPTIITVPFHDIADCRLVTVSANLEPHQEVRLILKLEVKEDKAENPFVWCLISIPYLKQNEEFQQLILALTQQQQRQSEHFQAHHEEELPLHDFTKLFDNKLRKKILIDSSFRVHGGP